MTKSSIEFSQKMSISGPSTTKYFLGCNWGVFKTDLMTVGGFNANFGPGSKTGARGQETDAQHRLLESGIKGIYIPGALVYHWVPKSAVSREWVMGRIRKSAMLKGRLEKRWLKKVQWSLKVAWYSSVYFFTKSVKSGCLMNRYLGRLEGSKFRRTESSNG